MKKIILNIIIVAIPFIYAYMQYSQLGESIPVHFDINGVADRMGSKYNIFMGGGIALLIFLILELTYRFDPKKSLAAMGSNFDKFQFLLVLLMSILGCVMVYSMSNPYTSTTIKITFTLLSCIFIVIGNYMTSFRPNYGIGFRTPWTLESEVVWTRTHRVASKLYMCIGLLGILTSWINSYLFLVTVIGGTVVVTGYLLWYSYHQFKLEQASKND
jgi:uncharacterized membrane protein